MTSTAEPKQEPRLSYPGDITAHVVGQEVGPNAWGEKLWIATAVYDQVADRTRCCLAYQPPSQSITATGVVAP